jgi:glutathione S-transferase
MTEIIFHHYWPSPFSEKVRVIFGMKKLAWRSVEIPNMMPKPDLMPLTGGYRKTPVMQIGADIYCDTQLIIRELERRYPAIPLVRDGGLSYGLGFWTDRPFFQATVPIIFGEIGPMVPEAFRKDREKMFPDRPFDYTQMKAASPMFRDQWRAHLAMIDETLASGKPYLGGDTPSVADAHCFMNVWFLRNPLGAVAAGFMQEFPSVEAWFGRVQAIGHGAYTAMDSKEALAVAKAATPSPARAMARRLARITSWPDASSVPHRTPKMSDSISRRCMRTSTGPVRWRGRPSSPRSPTPPKQSATCGSASISLSQAKRRKRPSGVSNGVPATGSIRRTIPSCARRCRMICSTLHIRSPC